MTYYAESFAGQAHALARSGQVSEEFRSVATGFGKLPDETPLKTLTFLAGVATGGGTNYAVTLPISPVLTGYVDQMTIAVRMPVANDGACNMDVMGATGLLGAKPIRTITGDALTSSYFAANSEITLRYSAVGNGYWTIQSGARGEQGPPTAPDGTFSVNAENELIFTPTGGTPANNLGRVAFRDRGAYAAATTYEFLDVVQDNGTNYWHHSTADTTGDAPSDTSVWRPFLAVRAFKTLAYAAALSWDLADNPKAVLTLTGNVTGVTLSNGVDGGVYEARIVQDGTGGRTITWPTAWNWPGKTAGVLSTAASAVDRLMLRRDGTGIYAVLVNDWGPA